MVKGDMSDPKKILIFSLVYYPRFIGGAEVAIKEITDRISKEEFEFDMITLRLDNSLPKFEKIGNVNVYRVGFSGECRNTADSLRWPLHLNKYFLVPFGFFKALSLHRKNKYDLIWSMMATYNAFAGILFKLVHPKVKYLLTLQEGDPKEHMIKRAKPLWFLFKKIFVKADHVQAISKYLSEFAREMGYKGKLSIVPNAVDFKKFSYVNESRVAELHREFEKKDEDAWLITTSRLVEKNGIGDVIEAMKFLSPNVKFFILGEGYQKDALVERVTELGIEDRVHFLGIVDHKDIPPFLHASDIFIRPSLSEGFGNSFIEAMAADVPVIGTEVGGIVDFLHHKKTGLTVGVHDAKDIALKIGMYMRDIDLREEIIENGREMVREKYDWSLIVGQMREIFIELTR